MAAGKLNEQNKELVQIILLVSGALFFVIGAFLSVWPQTAAFLFDEEIARIFGAALAFTGITDIIIAKAIFGKKDKHDTADTSEH